MREDILKLLNLNNPKVFVSGFDRENLYINVIKGGNKDKFVLDFVEKNKDVSGIIYALTRKEVESIYIKLSKEGYKVARYHGGMPSEERNKNQEDFVYDRVNIIIATNAFGMGIDKSDIRYIIHYNMPQNIEGYYQEIGRAGRDNEKSECILLFSSQDLITIRYLIENSTENVQRKNNQYKKMQDMVDFVYTNSCYRKYLLNYFGETLDENCNNCSNCNTSGEVKDKTIDAQKVISCIYRMKRPFGTNMIVDVLRGSKNAKIMKLRFNELSTYGIMKKYTKTGLRDFINTLEEISKEIEISVSTIMGYVYEYIKDGNTVDFNFDYSMYYNPEYDEEIKKAISYIGYDKVSLIIKKVSDNIKFENIRAYILKYIVKV